MKILVTGSNGFIGRKIVVKMLSKGYQVIGLDKSKSNLMHHPNFDNLTFNLNSENMNNIRKYDFNYVIHAAAQTSVTSSVLNPKQDVQSNIFGTLELISAISEKDIKGLIYLNSGGAIYDQNQPLPFTETSLCAPSSPYGISKLAAEYYLQSYAQISGISFTSLRLSNVYTDEKISRVNNNVIEIWFDQILKRNKIVVNGAETMRDFVHVDDVVSAIDNSISGLPGIYNIGSGSPITLKSLASKITSLINFDVEIEWSDLPKGEVMQSYLDITKAKQSLGWEPETDLTSALGRYWDNLKDA